MTAPLRCFQVSHDDARGQADATRQDDPDQVCGGGVLVLCGVLHPQVAVHLDRSRMAAGTWNERPTWPWVANRSHSRALFRSSKTSNASVFIDTPSEISIVGEAV